MGVHAGELKERLREFRAELADLVLPSACAGCGEPRVRGGLCGGCGGVLGDAVPQRVRPSAAPAGLPRVYGALPYAGEVRGLLITHKERGALPLAVPLGKVLAAVVRTAYGGEAEQPAGEGPGRGAGRRGAGPHAGSDAEVGEEVAVSGMGGRRWPALVTLVPVPSARRAVAARGHDPVRRLALAAARELRRAGLPARALAVLRHRRAVEDQAGLNAGQRLANLRGSLELVPGAHRLLAGGQTVVVDDLITTGASLAEAARTVRARGQYVAAGAVVAFR